ncbi:MAG: DUF3048 domain-containing protein [Thermoflexales bacterium]|nr:DUF3048 domain-containing protein [Thermoflexales bacterium]MDW8352569.1 DUF3048 domain-containing protein [Anaerolineae bacterium]
MRIVNPRRAIVALSLICALFLAACGSAEPTAAPEDFQPVVTIYAPTVVPSPTAAPPTPLPQPTATEALQAAAAVADAPASVSGQIAENVNPFTGLAVADPAVLQRRPLLIKVANTSDVRPQSGLNSADIVVEHYSEGSITRFTALFLTNAPARVGSVRSCRLIDIELPVIFDAALLCSGTSPGVKPLMRASWAHRNNLTMISDMGGTECPTCPMFRTSDRLPPHNLFANPVRAWQELDKRGKNVPSTFRAWTFDSNPPPGKPTTVLEVGYKSGSVIWSYDPRSGRWLKSLRNEKQIDALTGEQIFAANVLVVHAPHVTTLIQEDVTGARSIEIQLWGEGPLRVFRDGAEIGGRWRRVPEVGMFDLLDVNGNKIPLKPGNTWIQLVPMSDIVVNAR